ncbi:MAG: ParA family protein [Planctomycetes bacterium]|nr:ParA family protein [Planctomycetota bacterium]
MRKIALVNQKGGVGKTTTAVNLSAALATLGRRVLLIDMDPQSNSTIGLGLNPHELKRTTYSVLVSGIPAREAIRQIAPNLFMIPSNLDLAGAEMELSTAIGREQVLRDAMNDISDFDFALLDCPPSLGMLNVNSLVFVDEIFIPMQCEFFALHGLSLLMRTIDLVRRRLNPGLAVTGVIPCMYDVRKGLARETVLEIEKHFGNRVFQTRIRTNVRLAEAPSHGMTIFDYAPDSYGAEDYMALAREVAGVPAPAPAPAADIEVAPAAPPPP